MNAKIPPPPADDDFLEGEVKWFDKTRGFGFVRPDIPGPDIFLHITGWTATVAPEQGMRVTFVVEPGRKGPECRNVRLEDQPQNAA